MNETPSRDVQMTIFYLGAFFMEKISEKHFEYSHSRYKIQDFKDIII